MATALLVIENQFLNLTDNHISIHSRFSAHLSNRCFAHHNLANRSIQHLKLIIDGDALLFCSDSIKR